ncbi:hypothetical protein FMUND_1119 [Fusarium mundagurra]|uniref:Uncharacterized protein n=1 Tax=Fusarium mundagurra TaxID=1567541 RepID=A0A8H5Z7B9_9HYPO|nr:hypothetical protein FMUND_1119 [Fusarium mundagurra]
MCYSNDKPAVPGNKHRSDEQKLTVDIGYAFEEEFRPICSASPAVEVARSEPAVKQTGVEFLSRSASVYNLEGQVPLALAMALALPLHNETSSMVKLPRPFLIGQDVQVVSPSSVDQEYDNLPRYMTLSSNAVFPRRRFGQSSGNFGWSATWLVLGVI